MIFLLVLSFSSSPRNKTSTLYFFLRNLIILEDLITSPENLSKLAKKHLEFELHSYKKSQIKNLNTKEPLLSKANEIESHSLSSIAKSKINKKYKENIKKAKELYNEPEKIPEELKMTLANKIEKNKENLKKIYDNPKEVFTREKLQQWGTIQIVKAFLGIPIVPGK